MFTPRALARSKLSLLMKTDVITFSFLTIGRQHPVTRCFGCSATLACTRFLLLIINYIKLFSYVKRRIACDRPNHTIRNGRLCNYGINNTEVTHSVVAVFPKQPKQPLQED
jgi:hypothetical protein